MLKQSPRGVLPEEGGGCSADVLRIFYGEGEWGGGGGVYMRGCDFNKVEKATLLRARFCVVVLLRVCFMSGEHLPWRTPLEDCF